MLHNVLVCLDGSQGWSAQRACHEVAFEFANHYRARLIGLYVQPLPTPLVPLVYPPEVAFGASLAMASTETKMRLAFEQEAYEKDRGQEFSAAFLEGARRTGVEATSHCVRGEMIEQIVEHAHAADLVLLPDAHDAGAPAWPLGRLVRRVARPVLLASRVTAPIRRIAVAYDGSIGADRALQASVDIAVNWPEPRPDVILIAVSDGPGSHAGVLVPAEEYLRGYDVEYRTRQATGRASDSICQAADEEGASLLSMGAYNHSSLREALLGSTTDEVVERRHQPLLLCH